MSLSFINVVSGTNSDLAGVGYSLVDIPEQYIRPS